MNYIYYIETNLIAFKANINMKVINDENKMEYLHIRVPKTLKKDLETIKNRTGVNLNSLCLEILRPAVKQRMKDLD